MQKPAATAEVLRKVRRDRSIMAVLLHNPLTAICREAEILAEKRHHVILESIRNRAGVRAGVDFKTVCDAVVIENRVQLGGIESQSVLIAYVYCDEIGRAHV